MKAFVLVALAVAFGAVDATAQGIYPVIHGGIASARVAVGGRTQSIQIEYEPPNGLGTSEVAVLTSFRGTSTTDEVTIFTTERTTSIFTLDDMYVGNDLLATARAAGYPTRLNRVELVQIQNTQGGTFEYVLNASYDIKKPRPGEVESVWITGKVAQLKGYTSYRSMMVAPYAVIGVTDLFPVDGVLESIPARDDSDFSDIFAEEDSVTVIGGGVPYTGYRFNASRMYVYPYGQEGTDLYCYLMDIAPNGQISYRKVKVGTVTTTTTGGESIAHESLTPDIAHERLTLQLTGDWGAPWSVAPSQAIYHFTPAEAALQLMKYRFLIRPDSVSTLTWLEVFTPEEASLPSDYRTMTWEVPAGATESSEYTIDPFEEGNPHRFPSIPGKYEVRLFAGELRVDADRDGTIKLPSEDNSDATSAAKPFRFWLNDDDDWADTQGNDIPGQANSCSGTYIGEEADYATTAQGIGTVNGSRDLVDYFPVFLDLKQLLTVLPPTTAGLKYKLKQADGAVNVVFTNLTCATAFDYLHPASGPLANGFGPALDQPAGSATKYQVTAEGLELFVQSPAFLNCIQNSDGGVILVDGRQSTTNPLVLSVEKDGNVITEVKLELSLSSVEDMYRHLNLRNGSDAPSGLIGSTGSGHDAIPTKMDERTAFPDAPGEAKWLFFVHGYNVSGEKARGWNAEMFKRFYWSKSKARFVGVYWFGNPGTGINLVQGYHWAVRNAAPTAQALAARVNALPGSKTVIGHSQGCWVTALAVADYGLSIGNLCLVDAAFARECFDGEGATDIAKMVPDVWLNSPDATWSANWHQLFYLNGAPSSDARSTLTWRNRLVTALGTTAVHSFYSSTEDVLASYAGTPTQAIVDNAYHAISDTSALGNFAWVVQEKTKGDKALYSQGSAYGGWGFNLTDPADPADPIYYWADSSVVGGCKRAPLSSFPDPATNFGRELYKRAPLFDPGFGPQTGCMRWYDPARDQRGPSWLPDLFNGGTGSAIVAANRSELLAEAFPSLSLPLGANASDRIPDGQEHNMPASYVAGQRWPSARGFDTNSGLPNWHHSDIREVAYLYTFQFFDRIKAISESTP